jgi:iron complex transport system ATP-binding protein
MSLALNGVSVEVGGRTIVSGIELRVGDGEFAGLLGPNGSGKSTILKTIYRVNRLAAGQIQLDDRDLLAMPARDAARRIAVVAQESAVEFAVTAWEMAALGRVPHKRGFDRDNPEDDEIIASALERVGATHLASRSFHQLSGGEKQRVLIARAIAQQADHLLLDEPTNHLDIHYQIEVLELVRSLGVTVLAALHDLSLAALYCDSIHLLSGGRLVDQGSPQEVITAPAIARVYGADVVIVPHPDTGAPQPLPRRHGLARPVQTIFLEGSI